MDRIWSPWRAQHVNTFKQNHQPPPGEGSIFARMAAENRDAEHLILWRGERVFVVMNLYPYNNGHVLIVPYRQVEAYEDLEPEEQIEIAATIARCIRWLQAGLSPEGFNVGMNLGKAGGAGIPEHLHVHVVPRWNGDTTFMPTIGEVKIIQEHLEETYRRLRQVIEAEAG